MFTLAPAPNRYHYCSVRQATWTKDLIIFEQSLCYQLIVMSGSSSFGYDRCKFWNIAASQENLEF